MRIIEIGGMTFASAGLSCTIFTRADRRVAMGMIRGAADKTNSMKDTVARELRRDAGFAGDITLPAVGQECRDPEIDTSVQFDPALDSSRSRGYGRYEI
jgi:hypothetical protein